MATTKVYYRIVNKTSRGAEAILYKEGHPEDVCLKAETALRSLEGVYKATFIPGIPDPDKMQYISVPVKGRRKRYRRASAKAKIVKEYLEKHPKASATKVSADTGVSYGYVHQVAKDLGVALFNVRVRANRGKSADIPDTRSSNDVAVSKLRPSVRVKHMVRHILDHPNHTPTKAAEVVGCSHQYMVTAGAVINAYLECTNVESSPAPSPKGNGAVLAPDILSAGAKHMADRAATYDAEGGERSISKTVALFNNLYGTNVTEEQGWMFMALLKMVRSSQGGYRADSYEDGAAYIALAGEAASNDHSNK